MAQMNKSQLVCPIMVGAFPPPMHGMAAVNLAVKRQLVSAGLDPVVINLAASSLTRSLWVKLVRIPRVARGLVGFLRVSHPLRPLYINVSGGLGQIYELLFICMARLKGMRIFLHHHCFSYLGSKRRLLTSILLRAAGRNANHIVQSKGISEKLQKLYGVAKVTHVSNAVFLPSQPSEANVRRRLDTIGFISNVSADKGIFEFLDLMDALRSEETNVSGRIAGPFQDEETRLKVEARVSTAPNVTYVGPKYGIEKEAFFGGIDLLVFPTKYANETEGLVNHEAMSRGIPVIAYGRGAIPEILDSSCGLAIDPSRRFVEVALPLIMQWRKSPEAFRSASMAAPLRFRSTFDQSAEHWESVLSEMTLIPGGTLRGSK